MKMATVNQTKKFMKLVSKLAPEEFLGLANVFCIQLFDGDKIPRDFCDILEDMFDKFVKLKKHQRKEIMNLLKAVTSGGENNGSKTIDSKAQE